MTESELQELLLALVPPEESRLLLARKHLDTLAHPPYSLGKLEDIAARLYAISDYPIRERKLLLQNRRVIVMAADNGVFAEGVAATPQRVTADQTINMLEGKTGVAVLAAQYGADLQVIDVGVNAELHHPKLIDRKIRRSTSNLARERAMTREEALQAVGVGVEAARTAKAEGYNVIGVGEMGIANTTTASAVLACLCGQAATEVTGRGAGLTDEAYQKKINVIADAIDLHKPNKNDPIDVLSCVGGFDIAAMTGVYLGAAAEKLPIVIDGFISVVAALCAARLSSTAVCYMFASHVSFERGYHVAIKELSLSPCLNMDMRLGEGSGCPLMFSLMDGALAIFNNMATFEQAAIDTHYLEPIKTKSAY